MVNYGLGTHAGLKANHTNLAGQSIAGLLKDLKQRGSSRTRWFEAPDEGARCSA